VSVQLPLCMARQSAQAAERPLDVPRHGEHGAPAVPDEEPVLVDGAAPDSSSKCFNGSMRAFWL
jgi:hypothetical protein